MRTYIAPKMYVHRVVTREPILVVSTRIRGSAYSAPTWDDTPTAEEAFARGTLVEWEEWE